MNQVSMRSRTKNTMFNVGSNFIVLVVKSILMFITRTVFIRCLGSEALGLNGLFTNVLYMLSLAELGVGQAINFSLYKPLASNDRNTISSLMSFYRKVYKIIGILILFVGMLLIPFLKYLINDIDTIKDVYLIYVLYLVNTVSTYFISYKETLIIADQKKYEITWIELVFIILLNLLQIVFLFITKNYIVYLIIQFFTNLLQRIVINIYISKRYKDIDFKTTNKIDNHNLKTIKTNVKAMFFHKVGDYCINGTDNLIISSFINIITVGLYSNYLAIISLINSFVLTIYNGLTASLGNLIATESYDKRYRVFNNMNFIAFLLHGFAFVVLINIFNDFIELWIGNEYQLDFPIVVCILINFYLTGMRVPCSITKSAAGIYDIDKFTPIIQSIINLIVSIVLVKYIGLLGVVIGTIVSSIALPSWQRPVIVYKYVLNKSVKEYFINYFKYATIIIFTSLISLKILTLINISNLILTIIFKVMVVTLLFVALVVVFFRKSVEYKYISNTIGGVIHGKRTS